MKSPSVLTRESYHQGVSFFTYLIYPFTLSSLDEMNKLQHGPLWKTRLHPQPSRHLGKRSNPRQRYHPTEFHSPSKKSAQPKYSSMRCCTVRTVTLSLSWETVNTSSIPPCHGATRALAMASRLHGRAIRTHMPCSKTRSKSACIKTSRREAVLG